MRGLTIQEIRVGNVTEFSKTITESDVMQYAEITGDKNPAHMDQGWAQHTQFKGRIVHGMLIAGLISRALGMQLPGPGTIYLSQELRFIEPVRIGDTVTVRVEVKELREDKNQVQLLTTCLNQKGITVLDGSAWVLAPKDLR